MSVDFTDPDRKTILGGRPRAVHGVPPGRRGRALGQGPGAAADVGNTSSPYVVDSQTFLVGSFNGTSSGVFRSVDGGTTWTKVFDTGVLGPVVEYQGKLRWLQAEGAGVITSTDGGATWTAQPAGGFISNDAGTRLVGLPNGGIASWSESQIVVSNDDGLTWRFLGPVLPYKPAGIAYSAVADRWFAYRFDCTFGTDNLVAADSMLRLDPA